VPATTPPNITYHTPLPESNYHHLLAGDSNEDGSAAQSATLDPEEPVVPPSPAARSTLRPG
jgi:hypothetical protein